MKEGRDDLEEHSLKENSKTESDQEAEEAEDLCWNSFEAFAKIVSKAYAKILEDLCCNRSLEAIKQEIGLC